MLHRSQDRQSNQIIQLSKQLCLLWQHKYLFAGQAHIVVQVVDLIENGSCSELAALGIDLADEPWKADL